MANSDAVNEALKLKTVGNEYFRNGDDNCAQAKYTDALETLANGGFTTEIASANDEATRLYITLRSNRAACRLNLEDAEGVLDDCSAGACVREKERRRPCMAVDLELDGCNFGIGTCDLYGWC